MEKRKATAAKFIQTNGYWLCEKPALMIYNRVNSWGRLGLKYIRVLVAEYYLSKNLFVTTKKIVIDENKQIVGVFIVVIT